MKIFFSSLISLENVAYSDLVLHSRFKKKQLLRSYVVQINTQDNSGACALRVNYYKIELWRAEPFGIF